MTDLRPAHCHLVHLIGGSHRLRAEMKGALSSFHRVQAWGDGDRAIPAMGRDKPSVAVISADCPPAGAVDLIGRLRRDPIGGDLGIIALAPATDEGFISEVLAAGADDVMPLPFRRGHLVNLVSARINARIEADWQALPATQRAALTGTVEVFHGISDAIANRESLPYGVVENSCRPLVEAVRRDDFRAILEGVRQHDSYTYVHSLRVATFLAMLGAGMGASEHEMLGLAGGGLLHDAGKVGIPHHVLNKPDRLTAEEYQLVQGHVAQAEAALARSPTPRAARIIAANHHEKLDGSGYPRGLKGAQLDDLSRMAAIVDVFGALTDRRPYKAAMPAEDALDLMRRQMAGTHLDTGLLGAFRERLLDMDLHSAVPPTASGAASWAGPADPVTRPLPAGALT
ncbi:HD domain-containing phosphohydrolase [Roseospirillum parvum]|uniref:HD domain-containing protein n=1 Tax=Roseospirillum parvum TaxID=83401 RepID=A0A1G8FAG0_9PROT|nr:HD domain-containing phosphohydrolase [Roseospirillum parvum]SDH79116.1 HD domain-containing protein [Roseospirillum parvum]